MMKSYYTRMKNGEKGAALMLVLCFLAVGGLTISTLLNLTTAGIKADKVYDEKVRLQYAADAGLEEALWKMQNAELPFTPSAYGESFSYNMTDSVNDKQVSVNITYTWPLDGLETDAYGTDISASLTITGGVIDPEEGKYKVQISYDGSEGDLPISKVAVWFPSRFDYVDGSSMGLIDDLDAGDQDPVITNGRGGKVFTWTFDPPVNFLDLPSSSSGGSGFTPGIEYPSSRKLYFNITPTDDTGGGSYSWVKTADTDLYLAWETGCSLYNVVASATDNITGDIYTLGGVTYYSKNAMLGDGVFQVRGSYRATGNTLMEDTDQDGEYRETLLESSSANITDIPEDAEIVLAYLYWSSWIDRVSYSEPIAVDTEILFSVNGQGVYFNEEGIAVNGTGNISATKYSYLPDGDTYSYACFRDVTDLVRLNNPQGNGEYTVANVTGNVSNKLSYAGWSLLLFYSSLSEVPHQLFLYDNYMWAQSGDTHTFTIEGFESPVNSEATLTVFVGEGDEVYGTNHDDPNLTWKWWPYPPTPPDPIDWIKFNGIRMYDDTNPQYNVWNGKSSGLDGMLIDGVDIDTFDVSSPIIDPGDTSAEVQIGTSYDYFNLIYIVLSFTSEYGGLTPNGAGIISYSGG